MASLGASSSRGDTPQARSLAANQAHDEERGDEERDEDQEDSEDKLYCYCQEPSYGDVRILFIYFSNHASRAVVGCWWARIWSKLVKERIVYSLSIVH